MAESTATFVAANLDKIAELRREYGDIADAAEGRSFTPEESRKRDVIRQEIEAAEARVKARVDDEKRAEATRGAGGDLFGNLRDPDGEGDLSWGEAAARALRPEGYEGRAVISAPVDVPQVVEPPVAMPREAHRILDLVSRRPLGEGVAFEYLRQTVRTNNAAAVADHGEKPESVFTVTPVQDRARVVAHLAEPIPVRFFDDQAELVAWLEDEMRDGVLDALERLIIRGDADGANAEEFDGVLYTDGTWPVSYQGDIWTTLRRGVTALQAVGVTPNAWVIHPADAETFDLTRESTDGGFLLGSAEANIFRDLPKVVTTAVPQGIAILGDWTKARLWIRQNVTLQGDYSGELFQKNEVQARAEGRYGFGLLMPAAFATMELEDAS